MQGIIWKYVPTLDIDMFDDSPKVGDKIKVTGKVKSIDEETGEVDVSYDDVTILKKNRNRSDNDDNDEDEVDAMNHQIYPESQSLDAALGRAFPNTQ